MIKTLEEAKRMIYGNWSGNPTGIPYVEGRCCDKVFLAKRYYSSQCTKANGYGPAGLYCKNHAKQFKKFPLTVNEKDNTALVHLPGLDDETTLCNEKVYVLVDRYDKPKISCPKCIGIFHALELYTGGDFDERVNQ